MFAPLGEVEGVDDTGCRTRPFTFTDGVRIRSSGDCCMRMMCVIREAENPREVTLIAKSTFQRYILDQRICSDTPRSPPLTILTVDRCLPHPPGCRSSSGRKARSRAARSKLRDLLSASLTAPLVGQNEDSGTGA